MDYATWHPTKHLYHLVSKHTGLVFGNIIKSIKSLKIRLIFFVCFQFLLNLEVCLKKKLFDIFYGKIMFNGPPMTDIKNSQF